MKKEKYYNPELEVIDFVENIIRTSGAFDPFDEDEEGTEAWD